MAVNDFTGKNIQDTYQKVVQTDGTNLADGTGSLLPISFDGNNVIISGSLTATEYSITSSVTNIQIATLSGSTAFGDSIDDTHQFTGSVDISGSITLQQNGILSSTSSFIFNNTIGDPLLSIKGTNQSAPLISGSGDKQIFIENTHGVHISRTPIYNIGSSKTLYVEGDTFIGGSGKLDVEGTTTLNSRLIVGSYIESNHYVSSSKIITTSINCTRITASSGISADEYTSNGKHVASTEVIGVLIGNNNETPITIGRNSATPIHLSGHITASAGIISASTAGKLQNFTHIEPASGQNILINPVGAPLTPDASHMLTVGGSIKSVATSGGPVGIISLMDGSITASQNISASGDIINTGNIIVGDKILLNNNTGADYIDYSDGGFLYKGSGRFVGNITSSDNISASNDISAFRYIIQDKNVIQLVTNLGTGNQTTFLGNANTSAEIDGTSIKLDAPVTASTTIETGGSITAKSSDYVQIQVDQTDSGKATFGVASGTSEAFFISSTNNASFDADIKFITDDGSGNTEIVRFKEDGKVGIGNVAPTEVLTVTGNISASGDLTISNINGTINGGTF